ncbi:UNVERIFIED_CONTAM: hypothetical protein Slati_3121600 [Sesamum latifolium]|uniref:Uncharacterized protein n=1 Tax=Sesamum latifolium TaxID=2727402 RepID=A0AAW2UVG0_9LAMI
MEIQFYGIIGTEPITSQHTIIYSQLQNSHRMREMVSLHFPTEGRAKEFTNHSPSICNPHCHGSGWFQSTPQHLYHLLINETVGATTVNEHMHVLPIHLTINPQSLATHIPSHGME